MSTERYKHHGKEVTVVSAVKGQHRDHCLCFLGCKYFQPGTPDNCEIAQANYEQCIKHSLVSPVYECAKYSK